MSRRPLLLVVDDDESVHRLVRRIAEGEGFEVETCANGSEAFAAVDRRPADLALVDVRMPGIGGLDVLRTLRQRDPRLSVVLMTGYASIDSAVEAVKAGALDYVTKPFDMARVKQLLTTVREELQRHARLLEAEGAVAAELAVCGMIGRSPPMRLLFDAIRRFTPHARIALVTGETGTGKELVARALHQLGPRHAQRFVTLNCSAVVETLLESELFGHVRGAFTGAHQSKAGLFEVADGGTLLLDEVGELAPAAQAKLLRVLETGEVQRVGAVEPRRVDVRVVAATNRELDVEVREGRFREDLFYRLNVVTLALPPLRARRGDIAYLTATFVKEFASRFGKPIVGVTPPAERLLHDAAWPGNVRQLRNTLEQACMLADGRFLSERELTPTVSSGLATVPPGPVAPTTGGARTGPAHVAADPSHPAAVFPLAVVERGQMIQALEQTGGNKAAAARLLGLSRRALYRRLSRHGLGSA